MSRKSEKNLIVGLDIGTSKVVAIVGEIGADGTLEIIGIGSHPSRGLRKGVVVNIESTVESIQRAVAIPADQKILHILPQEFIIDNQDGIKEPIGMSGVRLEAKVHIVTGALSAAQNIIKCVRRCGLEVDDIILEQIASSY